MIAKGEEIMYTISRGGCSSIHPSSFVMSRPEGLNNYLLLIIKTHCNFVLMDKTYFIHPGTAIIIDKNMPYSYHNPKGDYIDDWLHFDTTQEKSFRESGIVLNKFFPLNNTNRYTIYIQQVLWEDAYAPSPFKEQNVDSLVRILINNLTAAYQSKEVISKYSLHYEKLKELRLFIQNEPYLEYTIQTEAKRMGIGISHFQHLYSKLFGISFQKDLIGMRTQYAANLILTTNLTIEKIAELCGYSSEVHFYRQFRSIMGMTPNEYRQKNHPIP